MTPYGPREELQGMIRQNPLEVQNHFVLGDFEEEYGDPQEAGFRRQVGESVQRRLGANWQPPQRDRFGYLHQEFGPEDDYEHRVKFPRRPETVDWGIMRPALGDDQGTWTEHATVLADGSTPSGWGWDIDSIHHDARPVDVLPQWGRIEDLPTVRDWRETRPQGQHPHALTPAETWFAGIDNPGNIDPQLWPQIEAIMRELHSRGMRFAGDEAPTDYAQGMSNETHPAGGVLAGEDEGAHAPRRRGSVFDPLKSKVPSWARPTKPSGPPKRNAPDLGVFEDSKHEIQRPNGFVQVEPEWDPDGTQDWHPKSPFGDPDSAYWGNDASGAVPDTSGPFQLDPGYREPDGLALPGGREPAPEYVPPDYVRERTSWSDDEFQQRLITQGLPQSGGFHDEAMRRLQQRNTPSPQQPPQYQPRPQLREAGPWNWAKFWKQGNYAMGRTPTNYGLAEDALAFLEQMRAAPDDANTRAVFADWLEDNAPEWLQNRPGAWADHDTLGFLRTHQGNAWAHHGINGIYAGPQLDMAAIRALNGEEYGWEKGGGHKGFFPAFSDPNDDLDGQNEHMVTDHPPVQGPGGTYFVTRTPPAEGWGAEPTDFYDVWSFNPETGRVDSTPRVWDPKHSRVRPEGAQARAQELAFPEEYERTTNYGWAEDRQGMLADIHTNPFDQTGHLAHADFLQDELGEDHPDVGFRRGMADLVGARGGPFPEAADRVSSPGFLLEPPRGMSGFPNHQVWSTRVNSEGNKRWDRTEMRPNLDWRYAPAGAWSWGGWGVNHTGEGTPPEAEAPADQNWSKWLADRFGGPVTTADDARGALRMDPAERGAFDLENPENIDPAIWPQIEALLRGHWNKQQRFADDQAPAMYGEREQILGSINRDPLDLTGHMAMADWATENEDPDAGFRTELLGSLQRRLGNKWTAPHTDSGGWLNPTDHGIQDDTPALRTMSAPTDWGARNLSIHRPHRSIGEGDYEGLPEGTWAWNIAGLDQLFGDPAAALRLGQDEDPADWEYGNWLDSRGTTDGWGNLNSEVLRPEERLWAGIDNLENMDPRIWPQLEALLRRQHGRGERFADDEAPMNYDFGDSDVTEDYADHRGHAQYAGPDYSAPMSKNAANTFHKKVFNQRGLWSMVPQLHPDGNSAMWMLADGQPEAPTDDEELRALIKQGWWIPGYDGDLDLGDHEENNWNSLLQPLSLNEFFHSGLVPHPPGAGMPIYDWQAREVFADWLDDNHPDAIVPHHPHDWHRSHRTAGMKVSDVERELAKRVRNNIGRFQVPDGPYRPDPTLEVPGPDDIDHNATRLSRYADFPVRMITNQPIFPRPRKKKKSDEYAHRNYERTAYGDAEDEAEFIRGINEDPLDANRHAVFADFLGDQDRDQDADFRRQLDEGIRRRLGTKFAPPVTDSAGWLFSGSHGLPDEEVPEIRTLRNWGDRGNHVISFRPTTNIGDPWLDTELPDGAWSWEASGSRQAMPGALAEQLGLGPTEDPEDWIHDNWAVRRAQMRHGLTGERHPPEVLRPEERLWAGIDDWANLDPAIWPQLEALLRRQHGRGQTFSGDGAPAMYAEDHIQDDFLRQILDNPDEATSALVYADWLEEQGRGAEAQIIRRSVEQTGRGAGRVGHAPATWGDRRFTGFPRAFGDPDNLQDPHIMLDHYLPDGEGGSRSFEWNLADPDGNAINEMAQGLLQSGIAPHRNSPWQEGYMHDWGQQGPPDERIYDQAPPDPERLSRYASGLPRNGHGQLEGVMQSLSTEGFLKGDFGPKVAAHYGDAEDQAEFEGRIANDPLDPFTHLVMADWLQDREHPDADFRRKVGESVERRRGSPWATPQTVGGEWGPLAQPIPHGPIDPYTQSFRVGSQQTPWTSVPAGHPVYGSWEWRGNYPEFAMPEAGPIPDLPDALQKRRAMGLPVDELGPADRAYAGIDNLENIDPRIWPQIEAIMRQQHGRGMRFADDEAPTDYDCEYAGGMGGTVPGTFYPHNIRPEMPIKYDPNRLTSRNYRQYSSVNTPTEYAMSTNYADEFDMTEPWHFPRQDWLEDVESDPESWGFPGTFSISRLSGHRVPSVDFDAADLNDYVADLLKEHPDADVHRMYIPSEMVPNPVLAEEMDEDPEMRGGYAWEEYGIGRRPFPVPTLLRDENGDLKIVDGNHRIHHWSGNHTHIPAKVVDLDSHKAAVRRALQMGLPVPPDVLADYPDLVQ